jgi:hypothetical protein
MLFSFTAQRTTGAAVCGVKVYGGHPRSSCRTVVALASNSDATHFLMKTLPRVAAEMALQVLAYNMTRVMSIMGVRRLLEPMRA